MSTDDGDLRTQGRDALWQAFVAPPDDARPRAWWHWMDGNIDPAGIVRDLTWLHDVGVRGVQLFDGGMGVPLVVPQAVRPGSIEWNEAVDIAVRTADELGLELAVATSSGWSAAGGPWVRPVDAMKKVIWSETLIEGGGPVDVSLADLPAVAGPYQDVPRWGGSDAAAFTTDWVVLAVPHDRSLDALIPHAVSASVPITAAERLRDGSFDASVSLPRDPDGWSSAWVEQRFDQPMTVRSVIVGLPGPRGFGSAPAPTAVLQASDDGVSYRDIVELAPTTVPVRSASFAPVTALRFRLLLSAASAAQALPPVSDGVRVPPVLRRSDEFLVSEFALHVGGRVHQAEAKAGFGAILDYYDADTDTLAELGAIDPSLVVDLTALTVDGVLRWDAPPGGWRILRLGASLTGQTNGPAPADSTGLEVDKLDGVRVAAYLSEHFSRFGDATAPTGAADAEEKTGAAASAASRFGALLSDSIESGAQNWTDRMLEHFERRRGYDPRRWLPALAGYLVAGADQSDRFLYDYRRTIAELLADEYYATLGSEARRRGIPYYAEALEDGRPQLGDDLAMRSPADVPMGAMWTFEPDAGPRATYVADLKGAASVAHVHGKSWVGSEAFTSFDKPWSWSPQALKHIADLQLSLGVTRFCIHTSPHQPLSAPAPGVALAPFLGQAFTVNETWSDMAHPWIDYLARCSAVLSLGTPAVDVAVFVGEEAPVTGLFDGTPDTGVPDGFDFDYIGADALADVLRVEDGRLVSDGAAYRLLHLGGSSRRLTLSALRQIERLLDAGAIVVGTPPESSPSLADDPAQWRVVRDRLWDRGRVIAEELGAAMAALRMHPALEISGGPVRRISRIVAGHLLTFVANPHGEERQLRLTPANGIPLVGWDPVTVRRVALGTAESSRQGSPVHTWTLPPFGSLFLVEDRAEEIAPRGVARTVLEGEWTAQVPGGTPIPSSPHPRWWTEHGAHERGFSGTGVYRHLFDLTDTAAGARAVSIEFGAVGDIARIVLNGVDCGIVWTAPFALDVTAAVRAGRNSLEVHVATPWRNRLIAESAHPSGEIFAPMTAVFEATAAPSPAGLDGVVCLRVVL